MNKVSKYEFFFSNWLNENMPEVSEGFFISNIDYILINHRTKKFLLLEQKTEMNKLTEGQKNMYNMLHKRFMKTNGTDGYIYIGTYLVSFNGSNFSDGFVSFKGNGINRERLDEYDIRSLLKGLLM